MGENARSYNDTGRTASTTYYYQISAYNSAGESWAPNYVQATTPAGTISAPTGTVDRPVD